MVKMSYNDRVQMIAEEMASKKYPDYELSSLKAAADIGVIDTYEIAASIAVAKIYESVMFFLDPVTQMQHAEINRRMIEYGLIPDKQD